MFTFPHADGTHSGGHATALHSRCVGPGFAPEHKESDTVSYFPSETFFSHTTSRFCIPFPQLDEQGRQSAVYHLETRSFPLSLVKQ